MAYKNSVGATVPTAEQQQLSVTQAKALTNEMRSWGILLDAEGRASYPKPRTGAELLFEQLISLVDEYKISIPNMPVAELKADVVVARAAESLERELAVAHQLAADTRLAGFGEAWQAFLGYYGVLSSMAARDPDLAKRLAPITDFMASRRRPQPQPKPTPEQK